MVNSGDEPESEFAAENSPEPVQTRPSALNFPTFQGKEFNEIRLPADFPNGAGSPRYSIGSHCRWIPTPATDWGIVIGQVCFPDKASDGGAPQWSWSYLLLLDRDSPSRQWLAVDWVDEDDLEPCPAEPTP